MKSRIILKILSFIGIVILSLGIGSKLNTIIEEQNWLLIIIFFVFLVIFAYFLRIIEN